MPSQPETGQRTPKRYGWRALNHLQVGRYAEYFAKMEFTMLGFDVYGAEVDDKGIDFVVRVSESRYFDVQVKSCRGLGYIFFPKDRFELRDNLLAAVVLLNEGEPPALYLIPASTWLSPEPPFVSRDYEGKPSPPEWGLNISRKHLPALERFQFDKVVGSLLGEA